MGVLAASCCQCKLCGSAVCYADDTTHNEPVTSDDSLQGNLDDSMTKYTEFLTANRLKINCEKTHTIRISTRQRRMWQPADTIWLDGGEEGPILPSSNERLLGVNINNDQSWKEHLISGKRSVIGSIFERIRAFRTVFPHIPLKSRLQLSNGVIISRLSYCISVWGGAEVSHIRALQRAQSAAARLTLMGEKKTTKIVDLLLKCKWLSVFQLIKFHTILHLWKIVHTGRPEVISTNFLTEHNSRLPRRLKGGKIDTVTRAHLSITRGSFRWRSILDYNKMPEYLRTDVNILSFRRNLRTWILENIPVNAVKEYG